MRTYKEIVKNYILIYGYIKKVVETFCKTPAFVPGSIFLYECPAGFGSEAPKFAARILALQKHMPCVATFPRYRSSAKRCKIEVCQPDCDALHRELELWHSGEEFGKKALRC